MIVLLEHVFPHRVSHRPGYGGYIEKEWVDSLSLLTTPVYVNEANLQLSIKDPGEKREAHQHQQKNTFTMSGKAAKLLYNRELRAG